MGLLATTQVAAQDYPSLSLRMAHPLPETWPAVSWDKWWAEEVERRSGGKIDIEIFWSGQLGGLTEIKSLVGDGAVELGVFAQAVHAEELPMMAASAGLLNRVSADPQTANTLAGEMYAQEMVKAETDKAGIVPIKWTVPSTYTLLCNKPVNEMADLEGLRVRAVGGAYVPIWMEEYGMVPTRVQAPELREGLERGTIDCNFGPIEWATFSELEEVAPYWSDINTGAFTTFQLIVSKESWDSWPQEVRDLMTEVAREAMEKDQAELAEVEQKAIEEFQAAGGEIVNLSDMDAFVARSPDMIEIWRERTLAGGVSEEDLAPIIELQRKAESSFGN
ncbi:hypothetical protein BOO69_02435 [Sulfitobacter alexandrii]|uniref:C4-dicarboxylate ABC transporter substrate-binding protein n=2 Tax=Sulfitobacter alexandrii TaxID=1917485 RepID=A0A1J0WE09_9RHOB|nr:hypothetical protein BOO69_02435 [Sulfitobacter alexandrii]